MKEPKPEKMKICKKCQTAIPVKTRKCPNCGKKQSKPGKVILIIVIVIILLIVLIGIAGSGSSGSSSSVPEEVVYVDEADMQHIYDEGESYIGKYVKVSGKVFNIETGDGETRLQVYADTENYENDFAVYYTGDVQIAEDDYIVVDGYISGVESGKNAFGGTITETVVTSDNIEISTYKDVVRPSVKTVEVNQSVEQNGYILTLNTIEFAEEETRCYFTFTNNGSEAFNLNDYSAVMVQGTTQFDCEWNYEEESDEFPDNAIATGVEADGVIFFGTADPNTDLTITVDGYSEENYDDETFTFDVSVNN